MSRLLTTCRSLPNGRKGPLEDQEPSVQAVTVSESDPESRGAAQVSLCGAERDRTVGLLNAIEALSQLSYSPPPACAGSA